MSLDSKNMIRVIGEELDCKFDDVHSDKEEFLEAITARVNELLASDPGLLFSYLYRLDVLEYKVKNVMNNPGIDNPAESLAKLILERQLQRLITKRNIKQKPIDGWEW